MLGKAPLTPSNVASVQNKFMSRNPGASQNKGRSSFIRGLTQLFGYRRANMGKAPSASNMEFVKVDANSPLRIAQAKMGKTFNTKLVGKLDELFDAWLSMGDALYLSN